MCEIQFDGFVFPAVDQISSQLAKLHYRSQGRLRMPVVVRIPFGGGIGAVEHHSESPGVAVRAHPRAEGRGVREPVGRALDAAAGDRLPTTR